MPSKVYTQEDREQMRLQLLDTALDLYSEKGIKAVKLMDILHVVGISKPFFYTFFDSVQEFVVQSIERQWIRLNSIIDEIQSHQDWDWKDKARKIFHVVIYHRQYKILVMTQEEQVWVKARISEERYQQFMNTQIEFFSQLLVQWKIPENSCDPKVLANMIFSMIIVYNSAKTSLPFFYLDVLEETANTEANCIIAYLDTFMNK